MNPWAAAPTAAASGVAAPGDAASRGAPGVPRGAAASGGDAPECRTAVQASAVGPPGR
jgi:hypothetical protein